jgi:hypothetical protein
VRNYRWLWSSFLLVLLSITAGHAQEIRLKGEFSAESVKIGEPVFYSFSVSYPKHLDVLLPDSAFNFAPFEFVDKTYYPTQSDSLYSSDSVVYTLSTFELGQMQLLRMPAYVLEGRDSTAVFTAPDTVYVEEMISVLTDSATFIEEVAYTKVEKEFNYPYAIAGSIVAMALLVILGLVFGKPLHRRYQLYRLKRTYKQFEKEYGSTLQAYESGNDVRPETLLNIWKKYMEQLEKVPYTKLTSKEIVALHQNGSDVHNILRPIDRGIYGRLSENRMAQSFHDLQGVARSRFQERIKEVRHA